MQKHEELQRALGSEAWVPIGRLGEFMRTDQRFKEVDDSFKYFTEYVFTLVPWCIPLHLLSLVFFPCAHCSEGVLSLLFRYITSMKSPFKLGKSRISEYITALPAYDAFEHGEGHEDSPQVHHHCLALARMCGNAGGAHSYEELWDAVKKKSRETGRRISANLIKAVASPGAAIDAEAEDDTEVVAPPPMQSAVESANEPPRAAEIRIDGSHRDESVADQIRRLQLELSEARAELNEARATIAELEEKLAAKPQRK